MPSYFDSLAKARAARLEREARDDSPLPIHVDPKSGLGSGLDIIPPSPAPVSYTHLTLPTILLV